MKDTQELYRLAAQALALSKRIDQWFERVDVNPYNPRMEELSNKAYARYIRRCQSLPALR